MRPEQLASVNSRFVSILRGILAVFLLLTALPSKAAPTPGNAPASMSVPIFDGQSFIQELNRLKTGLEAARQSTDKLRAYREALPESWAVDAGGRHYDVPAALLASRLLNAEKLPESRAQEIGEARDYLDALSAETAATLGRAPGNPDSARAKLQAILARSEYGRTREASWWDNLRARIAEMFYRALQRILRGIGGEKSLGNFLLWIGVCTAAILIAYWMFRNWFRAAKVEEMALQAAAVPVRSWQEWVFAAREAAEQGDYRGAIHCAYWAGVSRLQELGALAPDRAKTPREYLGALSKSKFLQPETFIVRKQALSALTTRLEKTWYGYRVATAADFHDSLAQLETLGCHLL